MNTDKKSYTEHLLEQESWWKRLLDVQRPYRIHLQRLKLGLVLDIGCGLGRNLINIGGSPQGVGIDHNPHSIAIARSKGLTAFTPEEFYISAYARPGGYDSLLLSHVAEHMRREEVVSLINEYIVFVRYGGGVIIITPQEAGFRSDPTHVEFMNFELIARVVDEANLNLLKQYSFPFHRYFGRIFRYNEFVTIAQKPERRN